MKKGFLFIALLTMISLLNASCPDTPWSIPVNISNSGDVTTNIFSAATDAGYMAVWADGSNNAHYSFSSDGSTWSSGLVTPAIGNVATLSDVFVAGNNTGFIVTWMDSSNDAWSSFSDDNGSTWSSALQINTTLSLNSNSAVYVSGGASGFVAALIGADNNAYITFSIGTVAWDIPTQITSDGSVYDQNWNSQTTRGFVCVKIAGESCMVTWINTALATASAYFESINPFSSTTVYPIVNVGFFESVPIVTELDGYFMAAARANVGNGVTYFSVATIPSNWATFSLFLPVQDNPDAGPWVAANHAGFLSTWVVGASQGSPGSPMWTLSQNNGFNWTPICPMLSAPSTTIVAPIGLSANGRGFVATWLDTNDANAYATFYSTPAPNPSSDNNIFVTLLKQKYGPLL